MKLAEWISNDEFVGPRLPWWLDHSRMCRPLFIDPDHVDAVKRMPGQDGVTHVWPGDADYDAATVAPIERSDGVIEWADRTSGTVRACGHVVGVLMHGYIT